jgi:hypothetical protein
MGQLHLHCEISFPGVIELHSGTEGAGELQPLSTVQQQRQRVSVAFVRFPFRPNITAGFPYDFIAHATDGLYPDPTESSYHVFHESQNDGAWQNIPIIITISSVLTWFSFYVVIFMLRSNFLPPPFSCHPPSSHSLFSLHIPTLFVSPYFLIAVL